MHVQSCTVCAADKIPQKRPKAPLGHLTSGAPWDCLAIDYLGPLPKTKNGNKHILVLTDHFTKYVEVLPVKTQLAEECALQIANNFISRWGAPLSIHSDQGAAFESKLFKELCNIFEVRKTRASPRNPKGNGQTERYIRTLVCMIKAFIVEQEEWDLYLGCIAGAYRSSPHEATSLTPNMMCLGREVRMPADIVFGYARQESHISASEHVEVIRQRMLSAHQIARRYLKTAAKRSKERYDTNIKFSEYEVGDLVWALHETRKVGVTPKLEHKFDGPFVVQKKMSPVTYVLQLDVRGNTRVAHYDKLKKYHGYEVPNWLKRAVKSLKRKVKSQDN